MDWSLQMITVKFYGPLRITHHIKELILDEGSIKEVMEALVQQYPDIHIKELKNSIIIVNKMILTKSNRLSVRLKTGDELVFMSPVSGG